jgi:hypothetical protein
MRQWSQTIASAYKGVAPRDCGPLVVALPDIVAA